MPIIIRIAYVKPIYEHVTLCKEFLCNTTPVKENQIYGFISFTKCHLK